jgi:uncharacterized protein (TIGR03085 family)
VSTVPTSLARRERLALCDLALALGPSAPTMCDDWTALDLVVHLLVRERRPWAAGGIAVPALRAAMDRASARLAEEPFEVLVARLRTPAAFLRPDLVESLVNTLELFVHHEDLRRAQVGWLPRTLSADDEGQLWRHLARVGMVLVRPAGVPVVISDGARTATLRRGDDPVVVTGPVGELTLFLYGRSSVRGLAFDGPADRVDALRSAQLGF